MYSWKVNKGPFPPRPKWIWKNESTLVNFKTRSIWNVLKELLIRSILKIWIGKYSPVTENQLMYQMGSKVHLTYFCEVKVNINSLYYPLWSYTMEQWIFIQWSNEAVFLGLCT